MWKEFKTYYRNDSSQLSEEWFSIRLCSLTAGNSGNWSGRSNFAKSPDEEADYICGLKIKSFDDKNKYNMNNGIIGEPELRKWDSQLLGIPLSEVGVSVWKENPIFRGSLDAEPNIKLEDNYDFFCEYKITQDDVYRPLIEYTESIKKGYKPPPFYHNHIFSSHYDQMTVNGIIHDRKYCHYVVKGFKTNNIYWENIPINKDHWEKELYPKGLLFYDNYIIPRMKEHNLKRIDPNI
jgi:hypothetical protein